MISCATLPNTFETKFFMLILSSWDNASENPTVVVNTGDVHQSQSAENNATVVPIQANSGDVECDAAIVQLQDLLDLALFGIGRNGPDPKTDW